MTTQTEPEITSHEVSNPLKTSSPQDTDQGSIIPTLFYRSSYKTKRVNQNKQTRIGIYANTPFRI
jgi:hypothetical protein